MWFQKNKIQIDKLKEVERALNVRLPGFLWDFYRNEWKLIQKFHKMNNDSDYIALTIDFDWMIEMNRDFLKLPKTEGLCRGKICIGTDGCGNDSFISLEAYDQRVFFIDHEIAGELIDPAINDFMWEDERLEKFNSLKEYLEYKIKILKEIRG